MYCHSLINAITEKVMSCIIELNNTVSLDRWPTRTLRTRLCIYAHIYNSGWSCEPNNQLNVCTTSVTEGEVAGVKLV